MLFRSAGVGDDVPQVGDGAFAESAFGALDEEAVLLQNDEDGAQVAKMIRP